MLTTRAWKRPGASAVVIPNASQREECDAEQDANDAFGRTDVDREQGDRRGFVG
jgi:hypothetical protein